MVVPYKHFQSGLASFSCCKEGAVISLNDIDVNFFWPHLHMGQSLYLQVIPNGAEHCSFEALPSRADSWPKPQILD